MGKYFSNDTDLKIHIDDNEKNSNIVIPSADNLTHALSEITKEKLLKNKFEPTNVDEYIDMVKVQTQQTTQMVQRYSEESKQDLKKQFDKFSPVELFEKINQLIFVVADLSNRIGKLEIAVKSKHTISDDEKPVEISDPADIYRLQQMLDNGDFVNNEKNTDQEKKNKLVDDDLDEIKKRLAAVKSNKPLKTIPSEGFTDSGIKLEEVFPNLDNEAYEAAYSELIKTNNNASFKDKPIPGGMRAIKGF